MSNYMGIRVKTKTMSKEEKYKALLPQAKALCEGETDMIAQMANLAALLHHEFGFWWTGFYRVKRSEVGGLRPDVPDAEATSDLQPPTSDLILGPFQGPLACMHIGYGKGVCGTAWKERRTVVVPDVEEFPGHIACSSESRSEIVVPIFEKAEVGGQRSEVIAVLDIDSRELATFDDTDRRYLEQLVSYINL